MSSRLLPVSEGRSNKEVAQAARQPFSAPTDFEPELHLHYSPLRTRSSGAMSVVHELDLSEAVTAHEYEGWRGLHASPLSFKPPVSPTVFDRELKPRDRDSTIEFVSLVRFPDAIDDLATCPPQLAIQTPTHYTLRLSLANDSTIHLDMRPNLGPSGTNSGTLIVASRDAEFMQTHVIFTATAQLIDFVQIDETRLMRKPEVLPGDVDEYPPETVPHCTMKWTPNMLLQWLLTHKVDRSKYEFHPSGSGSGAWCVAILTGLDNNGVLRTGTSKALQWVIEQCSTKAAIPDKVGLWIG